MNYKPGSKVEKTGLYWCTVCKTPARFTEGEVFPPCQNMCSRGNWHPVDAGPRPQQEGADPQA
jgi:hypothetical protein